MSLRTPTQQFTEKKVHTPPSVERDPSRPKLLKSLSGKVFKRSSNSDNDTFASTGLFVPTPSLSNRYPLPKPLNIPQPLSPPPSVKKAYHWSPGSHSNLHHNDVLESPIQLTPCLKIQTLEKPLDSFNLASAFNSGTRSEPRTEVSPHDNTIIWTDTVDDPYLEEDSPTYLTCNSGGLSSVIAKGGHRTFMGSQCSMCDEEICSVLSGEKILELTCTHASHYQCYLATLECLHPDKKFPQCRICGRAVKPSDKSILEKMVTHLLSSKSSAERSSTQIEPQWLHFGQPETASRHTFFTPGEQVIRTADVTSNGFRTPSRPLRSASDGTQIACNEPYEALFQRSIWLEETLLNIIDDDEQSDVDDSKEPSAVDIEPKIEVIGSQGPSGFGVTVKVPRDAGKEVHQEEENAELTYRREALERQVEEAIKEEVDNDRDLNSLVMFDKVDFSSDGDRWNRNIMLYLFCQYLLLFDRREMSVRGKVPLKQVFQVLKLDDSTLLIDLKSRTLPQLYLSFPSKTGGGPLPEKWKYYLCHVGKRPALSEITATSWNILPKQLTIDLDAFFANAKKSIPNSDVAFTRPWQSLKSHVPLQLIVCLSLSNNTAMDDEQYRTCVRERLQNLLGFLNDEDLLGLVAVGKDGRGNVGKLGTFVGTINKHWPHWDEALSGLEAVDCSVFETAEEELDKMLATCLRLVSTADSMLEEDQSSRFSKQVILLRDGPPPRRNHKYGRLITDVHGFNITQTPAIATLTQTDLRSVICALHQSFFQKLVVTLAGESLSFGSMALGEQKTLPLNFDPRNSTCQISWFDPKTRENVELTQPVKDII